MTVSSGKKLDQTTLGFSVTPVGKEGIMFGKLNPLVILEIRF